MTQLKEKSKQVLAELAQVFDLVDEKKIDILLTKIVAAERVFLMGIGREGLATRAFAMRLMHCGKDVHWVWDDTTPNVTDKDLFIFTSGSGEIGHIDYVMNEVKKYDPEIVLFTGVPGRKSAAVADLVVWVPAEVFNGDDRTVPSTQLMGSLFEQSLLILFDLIVSLYVEKEKLDVKEIVERHRNFE